MLQSNGLIFANKIFAIVGQTFSGKFTNRLGSHRLRVETDRWLPVKPPTCQRKCRRCDMIMNAVENEQHFLFYCPLYTGIRQQHTALFGPEQHSPLFGAQC